MLADALAKSLHNLLLPGILKLFVYCMLAYAVGGTALAFLLGYLLSALIGATGAQGFVLSALGTFGGGMLAWFLFPLLYPLLVSFFDDYMAEAIEQADYPELPKAEPPFWPTFAQDAWFSAKAVALNILLLPFYLIPLFGLILYYLVNGWLLGKQFFRMSAGRRVSAATAQEMQRKFRASIVIGGVMISFAATIPLLNLVAPLLGVAMMLHLFHAANGTGKAEILNS